MSSLSNWSYTAKATIWRCNGKDEYSKKIFTLPVVIMCDYGCDLKLSQALSNIGRDIVIKNTFWTEFEAQTGDYILLGEHEAIDPIVAGASEIVHVLRYADTFERQADDFALITAV